MRTAKNKALVGFPTMAHDHDHDDPNSRYKVSGRVIDAVSQASDEEYQEIIVSMLYEIVRTTSMK